MFLNLQFSEAKFLELMRDQVQRNLPVFRDELIGRVVDHFDTAKVEIDSVPTQTITIAGPGGPVGIPGSVVHLKISLDAKTTTRHDVIAAGNLGVPPLQAIPFWVVSELVAGANAGSLVLTATPIDLGDSLGFFNSPDGAAAKATVLARLKPIARTIAFPPVGGEPLTVSNAGLIRHASVIAIAAEITPPGAETVSAWKDFYAGKILSLPGDWSIVLPPGLLVGVVDDAVTASVKSFHKKNPNIDIVSEPDTSWTGAGAVSLATISAQDACPVTGTSIGVNLEFNVAFSLDQGDIKLTVTVKWYNNDWDVFLCAASLVLVPGAVVTVILGALAGPIGAVIGILATIVVLIVAIVMISDGANGKLSNGIANVDPGLMNLHEVEKDGSHVVIEGRLPIGALFTGMIPTAVVSTPWGLQISGTMAVDPHQERSLHLISQSGFGWDAGYSCTQMKWRANPLDATIAMTEPADYPLTVEAEILTQPPSSYSTKTELWFPVTGFKLSAHSNLAGGTKSDCEVLIWTNSGVRYADMGYLPAAPPVPNDDELMKLQGGCFRARASGPKQWLEIRWLVDPPPYDGVVEQIRLWDVVAQMVAPGADVDLAVVGARGDTRDVITLAAGSSGEAEFRLVTGKGESLALSSSRGLDAVKLFVGAATLEPIVHLRPLARVLDAAVSGSGPTARVKIATADGLLQFSLDGTLLGHTAVTGQHAEAAGEVMTPQRDSGITLPRTQWLAEPWMRTPLRAGNLAARVQDGAVVVYRYVQTYLF